MSRPVQMIVSHTGAVGHCLGRLDRLRLGDYCLQNLVGKGRVRIGNLIPGTALMQDRWDMLRRDLHQHFLEVAPGRLPVEELKGVCSLVSIVLEFPECYDCLRG